MMSQSKISDVALVCALDICRAATRIQPDPNIEIPVHALALDLAHEVKVRTTTSWTDLVINIPNIVTGHDRKMEWPETNLGAS